MSKKKIVVVGNGMVGHKFIDNILQSDSDEFDVITFSEEPRLAYDRVQLTAYFKRGNADDLALTSEEYYQSNGVNYLLNAKVAQLDTENKCVVTESGHTESYDTLILATGSFPFVPPIPGNDQEHCHVYRTIEDLDAIELSSKGSKSGVVIGGGLLGLEAANAVKNLGLETHVVEFAPRLMAVQLDDGGGALLRRKIEDLGVQVHTEKATSEIVSGESARYRMNFADGTHLETDMIVFSAGIRPQDALARSSDIAIGERGGIVINDHCQTNIDNVYAIGDCAEIKGRVMAYLQPAILSANVLAKQLTMDKGEIKVDEAKLSLPHMFTKVKSPSYPIQLAGRDIHTAQSWETRFDPKGIVAKGFNEDNQLVGFIVTGEHTKAAFPLLKELQTSSPA